MCPLPNCGHNLSQIITAKNATIINWESMMQKEKKPSGYSNPKGKVQMFLEIIKNIKQKPKVLLKKQGQMLFQKVVEKT